MNDNPASRAASTDTERDSFTNAPRSAGANWRGLLVFLPGIVTLILWEIAAWEWQSVAKLVSQPTEIACGIVQDTVSGT